MAEKLLKAAHTWRFVTAVPPREVFAAFEQMAGTPPYRFEVTGSSSARVVEVERCNILGAWRKLARRDAEGRERTSPEGTPLWRTAVRWVSVEAVAADAGTAVTVIASTRVGGPLGLITPTLRAPVPRALQVVQLLTRGVQDRRSVYRDRRIPLGPVSLVASWAGTGYPLYLAPAYGARRGEVVYTASRVVATDQRAGWVGVRTESGAEGWMERDQIVPASEEATRAAQERSAAFG